MKDSGFGFRSSTLMRSPWRSDVLGNDEVRIWRVNLDQPKETVNSARELLTRDEVDRADRGTPVVRRRRILSRAALRIVLGTHRSCQPEEISLTVNAFGKPITEDTLAHSLHFNTTASGDNCLVAVTRLGPVGIDIEGLAGARYLHRLGPRFLSAAEVELLDRVPERLRPYSMLRSWTYKEAYVKAIGLGLAAPLDRIVVGMDLTEPTILALDDADPFEWTIAPVRRPGPAAIAAVAMRVTGPITTRLSDLIWSFASTPSGAGAVEGM